MPGESTRQSVDVIIVVDTTGSMEPYLLALQRVIPQLLALRSITSTSPTSGRIDRIGILSYTDYYSPPILNPSQMSVSNPVPTTDEAAKALIPRLTTKDVVDWSGWVDWSSGKGGGEVLIEWAKGLSAEGGGDYPEAAKSALKFLLGLVAPSSKEGIRNVLETEPSRDTVVLWYTDSPPHHLSHPSVNRLLEIAAHSPLPASKFPSLSSLTSKENLGTNMNLPAPHPEASESETTFLHHGELCTDWTHLCFAAKEARLRVYSVLPPSTPDIDASFWVLLGEITGGATCAIGGRRTDEEEEEPKRKYRWQAPELANYVTGGGDFVRAVMNVSMAIVLDELKSDEEAPTEEQSVSQKTPLTEDTSNSTKVRSDLDQIRWLSYKSDDVRQYLPERSEARTGMSSASKQNTKATGIPTDKARSIPLSNKPLPSDAHPATSERPPSPMMTPKAPHTTWNENVSSNGFLPTSRPPQLLLTPTGGIRRDSPAQSQLGQGISRSLTSSTHLLINTGEYQDDSWYWDAVMDRLKGVVIADVESLSTTAVFAEAWEAVNKLPPSSPRDALFSAYVSRMNKISDIAKRERLLRWADMKTDALSEVRHLLQNKAVDTLSPIDGSDGRIILTIDGEAATELSFSRDRLLALATNCDRKTLSDAGYMLRYTRLVTPNDAVSEEQSINLSTTSPSTLFRVLPHFFMPGTLYSNRTASMLAVVALTGHIPHLLEPAKAFLSATRGTWLSTALPENFSTPFIRFMLSIPSSRSLIFSPEEHDVYSEMARYVHLEDQIDTKIQAKVPWTPMKSRGVGDRKRLCDGCGIRRSETMMHQVRSYVLGNMKAGKEEVEKEGDDGMRCGMCVDSDTKDPKDWKDQGEIRSCWVECSERWCRAQYVIEDEEGLRIPPRCYYCRKHKPSPWIECTRCANRIILPRSYRVLPGDSPSQFVCPPCQNSDHTGHKTVVHKLTTLRSILFANEYEVGWLGVRPFMEIFRGRSTFVIWELYGNEIFKSLVPSTTPSPPLSPSIAMERRNRLLLNGKKLLNPQELKKELDDIVSKSMKKGMVVCGMTFDYFDREELIPACGNPGCEFTASRKGLQEWYSGSSLRRKRCPSCDRKPVVVI